MSEDLWQSKDYGDYFQSLQNRLDTPQSKPVAETKPDETIKPKRQKRRLRKSVLVLGSAFVILVAAVILLVANLGNNETPEQEIPQKQQTEEKVNVAKKISYSSKNAVAIPATNDAKVAIVVDKTKNKVIAERNAHEKAYPASTTKVMTLLVAAENITDFDDTFTMTYEITDPLWLADASVAGFLNGEEVNMKDLLYGTILPSGADAATALAIKIAGSEEEFVKLMNRKVKDLGLKNTHFTNVTGLHNEENYTTAYDMAIMIDAAMQNELCREILSTYQYSTAKTPQNPDGILLSNTIFEYMYGTEPETATILGGKTGFVNESGYCIASFGKCNENGNEYIVVTLGNSSRWPAFYGQIDLYKEFAK